MERIAGRPKLPKNYQLIYDVLCAQAEGHHASAGEIHAAAKRQRAGLGYSTVYRALDRLRDLGLVLEVRLPGTASALYEPSRPGHAHFHCVSCGRVADVAFHLPEADLTALAEHHRIEIDTVVTTFNGLCEECRPSRPEAIAERPASSRAAKAPGFGGHAEGAEPEQSDPKQQDGRRQRNG